MLKSLQFQAANIEIFSEMLAMTFHASACFVRMKPLSGSNSRLQIFVTIETFLLQNVLVSGMANIAIFHSTEFRMCF